jgi:hypothetical protein
VPGEAAGQAALRRDDEDQREPHPARRTRGPGSGRVRLLQGQVSKGTPPVVTVTDQFGTHTFTPSAAQLLCAPAQAAPLRPDVLDPFGWMLFARPAAAGVGLPRFIEREFRTFLRCGLLVHGLLRVRCDVFHHRSTPRPGDVSRASGMAEP